MAQPRQLAVPTYLVAFTLLLIPPFDSMMTVVPFRFGDAHWRFGAFGLLSNALMLSLTGFLIALVATSVFDHPGFRRALGVISGLFAIVFAGGWIIFALDALQVRNDVKQNAALAFKIASATAASKSLLAIVTLIAITIAAFKAPRTHASTKGQRSGGLIVGGRPSQSLPGASVRDVSTPAEPS